MIGRFIQQQRLRRNLTQKYVAAKLGISRSTYKRIEYGKRELTLNEAEKLALVFEMSLENLLEREEPRVGAGDGDEPVEQPVEVQIRITEKSLDKFRQILLYVLTKVGAKPAVGESVLHKLLYFIDFDYYEKYEDNLMGLTYIKGYHGPVPAEFAPVIKEMQEQGEIEAVQSAHFRYPHKKYLPLKEPVLDIFNAREIKHVDSVLQRFSDKDAAALKKCSCQDSPWLSAEYGKPLSYENVFSRGDRFSAGS